MGQFGKELCERARKLAVAVIRLSIAMPRNPAGWEVGKQVVRSSNSIAANLEEAQGSITDPDFLHKVNLARKEARETYMWLLNIKDSGLLNGPQLEKLLAEANELVGILVTSVKTLEKKNDAKQNTKRKQVKNSRFATRDSQFQND